MKPEQRKLQWSCWNLGAAADSDWSSLALAAKCKLGSTEGYGPGPGTGNFNGYPASGQAGAQAALVLAW